MPQQPQSIEIRIPDEVLKGVYSNLMYISHTKEEFVLDFINVVPPKGVICSRVITSPYHAKRVLKALEENIKKYEDQFGVIQDSKNPGKEVGFQYEEQADNKPKA